MDVIRLPPWSVPTQWIRVAWASGPARAVWESRVERICTAMEGLEAASVYHGLRAGGIVFRAPDELPALTEEALRHGCTVLPVAIQGNSGTGQTQAPPYVPGRPSWFRVVVTSDPKAWTAVCANRFENDVAIGNLLGYPQCCVDFYKKYWIEHAWRDLTYPASLAGLDGPPEANILLRWIGVRFVRHLPCSFKCPETIRVAQDFEALGRKLGYEEEMDWLRTMLSWNIEWSSLHGIAQIRTPVLKISTDTDPLAKKVVLSKPGTEYPDEGATGLEFPFEQPSKRKITESKSFRTSLGIENLWLDNGFASKEAMDRAHVELLTAVKGVAFTDVLDLGCGNGLLLEKLCSSTATPHGVELDRDRWLRAYERLSGGFVVPGNIKDTETWNRSYDLIVFMPGRLNEFDASTRKDVVAQLAKARYVLLYAYGDRVADTRFDILPTHRLKYSQTSPAGLVQLYEKSV